MKLYDITSRYSNILDLLENEEIEPEFITSALNEIDVEFKDKVTNITKIIRTLESEIEAYKSEESRLYATRKAKEKKLEGLKEYLINNMENLNMSEVKTDLFNVKISSNREKVVIDDEALIPDQYKQYEKVLKIDKNAIRKDFGDNNIDGCHLERGKKITIK